VLATAGVHPHDAHTYDDAVEAELGRLLSGGGFWDPADGRRGWREDMARGRLNGVLGSNPGRSIMIL
jgi:hypothetical protein